MFLILSPGGFEKSLLENFEKFEFGKTWAQTEITGEDDLPRIFEFIQDSFDYVQKRRELKDKT
ncbi:MAG: hypothetical protein M1372_00425 [Patescibacteria group bacterium]|nr:hypothetical protein [Patescibacteria group bacterium]